MMKLAAVAFLCSRGVSAIDDSSALIQQHHTDRDVGVTQGEIDVTDRASDGDSDMLLANICTKKDLDNYAKKQKEFQEKLKEFQEAEKKKDAKRAEKAEAKSKEELKGMEENMMALVTPMLDQLDMVAKYLVAEARPGGLSVVKSVMQKVVSKSLVDNSTALDFHKTCSAFLERWNKEVVVHVKSLLQDGFKTVHERIEKTIPQFDPWVQSHLVNATFPVHNEQELEEYIVYRLFPVMLLKTFPLLDPVAKLYNTMPSDPSQLLTWAKKEVLPTLQKHLPKQCQPTRLMTTLGLGMGDFGVRLGKFVEVCQKSLGMKAKAEQPEQPEARGPSPPVRKCSTCEEFYKKQSTSMDENGCMRNCMTAVASCATGMTTTCLHQVHPCLRCHKRKLAAFDDCRGTNTHEKMIEMLGDLATVAKKAPNSGKDVSAWADSFMEAIKVP